MIPRITADMIEAVRLEWASHGQRHAGCFAYTHLDRIRETQPELVSFLESFLTEESEFEDVMTLYRLIELQMQKAHDADPRTIAAKEAALNVAWTTEELRKKYPNG